MGILIVLGNVGPIDRTNTLDTIIDKVMSRYEARYGRFLKSDSDRNLKAVLEGKLNPKSQANLQEWNARVRKVSRFIALLKCIFRRAFHSLLQLGNMGECPDDSGVYMHILWKKKP